MCHHAAVKWGAFASDAEEHGRVCARDPLAVVHVIRLQPRVAVAAVKVVLTLFYIASRRRGNGGGDSSNQNNGTNTCCNLQAHIELHCNAPSSGSNKSAEVQRRGGDVGQWEG